MPETYVNVQNPQGQTLGQVLLYPRLDKVNTYLDWRVAFAASSNAPSPDFEEAAMVAVDAWEKVVAYTEQAWRTHLV